MHKNMIVFVQKHSPPSALQCAVSLAGGGRSSFPAANEMRSCWRRLHKTRTRPQQPARPERQREIDEGIRTCFCCNLCKCSFKNFKVRSWTRLDDTDSDFIIFIHLEKDTEWKKFPSQHQSLVGIMFSGDASR